VGAAVGAEVGGRAGRLRERDAFAADDPQAVVGLRAAVALVRRAAQAVFATGQYGLRYEFAIGPLVRQERHGVGDDRRRDVAVVVQEPAGPVFQSPCT